MAKKKSKRKAPVSAAKRRPKLETTFNCPFCNREKSVECRLDRASEVGIAKCRGCGESYRTVISAKLSDPIDIYSEWIDACERANDR